LNREPKKKKKGVTRVARNREPRRRRRCVTGQSSDYVATDPRKEGVEGWKGCYMGHTSDYVATEPWNREPKKKGVTWVIQATTSQRNPGCTEKRILVQDQDGGNAQHGKDRTQHHKHLQKGLSERRGPRAMLHTQKACHTDRRASTSKEPNTHTQCPGATHF
jgi:hypothetical protein